MFESSGWNESNLCCVCRPHALLGQIRSESMRCGEICFDLYSHAMNLVSIVDRASEDGQIREC